MVVQSSPVDGMEDAYNVWYDNTHIPEILEIPGFVSARRFRVRESGPAHDGAAPKYLAIYELDADDVGEPVAELGARMGAGKMDRSEALQRTPAPIIGVYELLE